jgi:hypothetical protein
MCEKNYLRCEDRPIELFIYKLKGSQPVSSTHGRSSFTVHKNLLIQVINKYSLVPFIIISHLFGTTKSVQIGLNLLISYFYTY